MSTKDKMYKLALLQLEQYETMRYLASIKKPVNSELVQRLRWTRRARLTTILSGVIGIAGANIVISLVVKIAEVIVWWRAYYLIRKYKRAGLKVVVIAGSYGKTSVKHDTYQILRSKYRAVATPESYNTIFGIYKCLNWEVNLQTEIFLVEAGAYKIGDITRILRMVQPDLGVLTGIARQHLERFGSFENIKFAKGEIVRYIKKVKGVLVANGSDEEVVEIVEKAGGKVEFYQGKERGEINLEGARLIAKKLGMSKEEVAKVKVKPTKNRFEITSLRYGMKVIDNSFSSNEVSFVDGLAHLQKQKKYTRILVTPGLVELGMESETIHEQLGKEVVGKVDIVILVGKSERTKSLERGIGGQVRVIYIKKTLDFMQTVEALDLKKEPLVLLENDVTENY